LDRLLASLTSTAGEPPLEALQAVELEGNALIEQLPDGVLRRSAEQRMEQALQGRAGTPAELQLIAAPEVIDSRSSTARQRAERRILRLFIHAAEGRTLLQCLSLQNPACRVAMEWLSSLAMVAVDGAIAGMALQLAGQLQGAVRVAITQAVDPGPDVIAVLQQEPQAELQALLEVLEPVCAEKAEAPTSSKADFVASKAFCASDVIANVGISS
jgi:hypothetical protein